LGRKLGTAECLVKLLADEESRDLILDDEALFHALLERRGCLRVTSRFYFYILVRHVFRRSDIQNRTVADYVAEVLAEFSSAERSRCVLPGQNNPLDYSGRGAHNVNVRRWKTPPALRRHSLRPSGSECPSAEIRGAPECRNKSGLSPADNPAFPATRGTAPHHPESNRGIPRPPAA